MHHALFPVADEAAMDSDLEERMQLAQDVCSLVLSLRKKVNIKVRQPLQKILIPVLNATMKQQLQSVEELIKAEVNIKEIAYITDTEGLITKRSNPILKSLVKSLGAKMKAVASVAHRIGAVGHCNARKRRANWQ